MYGINPYRLDRKFLYDGAAVELGDVPLQTPHTSYLRGVGDSVGAPTDAVTTAQVLARSIAENVAIPTDAITRRAVKAGAVLLSYGTSTAITITLAGLPPDGAARSSLAIDNTTDLFLDALVQLQVKTGSDAIPASCVLNIYAYGTSDGGTSYPEGTGTDVAVTLTVPNNLVMIGQISIPANTTSYTSNPFSVAAAFGGAMPAKWGVVVEHITWSTGGGSNLDATGGNFKCFYQGIKRTVG